MLCFDQIKLVYAEVSLWISRELKHLSLANNLPHEIHPISVNSILRHGYSYQVFEDILTQQQKRDHLLWFADQMFLGESLFPLARNASNVDANQ